LAPRGIVAGLLAVRLWSIFGIACVTGGAIQAGRLSDERWAVQDAAASLAAVREMVEGRNRD